ncbi:MAG TPA: AsmA-like C-terminal region-containing protein, partial [Bryobacteraceae bacterium]|nr:AsmA-like C-terminal region-containing protein [Bryobacteraceae bacterium]
EIVSKGRFGPWIAGDPSSTYLAGNYVFEKADLGVFNGIAGILHSTGNFEGTLSAISARGQATVPDFRLKMSGNRVPLKANFEVLVDGTNGNTILKPVRATLGSTWLTTSGGIIKHEGDRRRSIQLDVNMPKGNMRDLLRLTSRQPVFMEGAVALKTKIGIPPLSGKVREKLTLDGQFHLTNGRFLRANVQEQLDNLSRRGQGQPRNKEIDEVFSDMSGRFRLANELLTFDSLSFAVPGADVHLAGAANIDADTIDLRGTLKLKARVSQTMTGWKRWALKPVDPFFAKQGAGTFLRVKVDGTFKEPKFGLDRRKGETGEVRSRTQ